MSKPDSIIRVQDKIQIVNPLIFVRCGYPLSKKLVKETIITEYQKKLIKDLLRNFGICFSNSSLFGPPEKSTKWTTYDKILDLLAGSVLAQKGYGGRQRQVFTEEVPEFKGVQARVVGRRVVKSGRYYGASGGIDSWTGECDWEPGGLADMKTHVILECYFDGYEHHYNGSTRFEIEKCHVEKVTRNKEDGELLIEV